MADITTMSGLLNAPSPYWLYPQQGYMRPSLNDYFFGDPSMGGMTAPDAPQAPQAAPEAPVAPGGEPIPPIPSAPPPMPPGVGGPPPGAMPPPPPMGPPPGMLNQPPPPPPMLPPPPPAIGQPGFIDPTRDFISRGGTGRQGGGAIGGGGGYGSSSGSGTGSAKSSRSSEMARGGYVPGDRGAPIDSQPVNATAGEFMLTRGAADALGPRVLAALNDPSTASVLGMMLERFLSQQGGGRSY